MAVLCMFQVWFSLSASCSVALDLPSGAVIVHNAATRAHITTISTEPFLPGVAVLLQVVLCPPADACLGCLFNLRHGYSGQDGMVCY